ncbi:MAG: hypothetical protein JW942_01465 [Opitutales bacterium]|nr:hypothetical protein [Opitutales bacterium]
MSLQDDQFVTQLMNLLSLRAFRPDAFDMTAPLRLRFVRQRLLGIVIYPNCVKLAKLHFGNTAHVEMIGTINREGPSDNELVRILSNIAKENPGLCAVVAYNYGFNAVKSFTIKRTETLWSMTKDNPQRVLGDDFEAGHSYSIVPHPTRESSIVFSYEQTAITSIERLLEQSGIVCVRLHHTIGSLFAMLVETYKGIIPCNTLIISGNSVMYLEVDIKSDHEWMLLRNRSENPSSGAVEAKRQRNLIEQILPKDGDLLLCVDQQGSDEHLGWEARLKELRPALKIKLPHGKNETAVNRVFYSLIQD